MRISQATEGINCLQCIDDLIQEAVAFFFPFSVLRVMGDVIRGRADGGGLDLHVVRLREHFDWPVHRRLTGEGATDVSPVKRRIANTVDGDRWKKGWMSGREKERYCEGEKSKKKKKKSWGKGIWRGTEEEKRWKYEEILAREWQKEIEAGGQRSEGCRVRVPLVARVDVT